MTRWGPPKQGPDSGSRFLPKRRNVFSFGTNPRIRQLSPSAVVGSAHGERPKSALFFLVCKPNSRVDQIGRNK